VGHGTLLSSQLSPCRLSAGDTVRAAACYVVRSQDKYSLFRAIFFARMSHPPAASARF